MIKKNIKTNFSFQTFNSNSSLESFESFLKLLMSLTSTKSIIHVLNSRKYNKFKIKLHFNYPKVNEKNFKNWIKS